MGRAITRGLWSARGASHSDGCSYWPNILVSESGRYLRTLRLTMMASMNSHRRGGLIKGDQPIRDLLLPTGIGEQIMSHLDLTLRFC
jgi:hypothetical protein